MSEADRSVLDAFVEEHEGDREKRLRREIETGKSGFEKPEQDGLEDSYGNPIMLHAHDRRAVEFRERMRTWSVLSVLSHLELFSQVGQVQPCPMGIVAPAECAHLVVVVMLQSPTRRSEEERNICCVPGQDDALPRGENRHDRARGSRSNDTDDETHPRPCERGSKRDVQRYIVSNES